MFLSKARFELAPSEEERHLKPPPWTARPSRQEEEEASLSRRGSRLFLSEGGRAVAMAPTFRHRRRQVFCLWAAAPREAGEQTRCKLRPIQRLASCRLVRKTCPWDACASDRSRAPRLTPPTRRTDVRLCRAALAFGHSRASHDSVCSCAIFVLFGRHR